MTQSVGRGTRGVLLILMLALCVVLPSAARAAPFAAYVMDARTGEVLHAENADSRLHPASLTKMMTLYIAFEAVRNGEITLDTLVTVSANAAAEPPSKLGLRAGQRIQLRYLIRAAAIKSANDAATAIGEAIGGSESAFADRMNRTAQALGMTRTNFRNMHGLTQEGHLSTARDMAVLGRQLYFDYPEYYNIFSRRSADAGVAEVANTNRRFLDAYAGADGIKTGYTRAAGFNLVASAQRGQERIIASVFGGVSTVARNAKVAELLDLGFSRAPAQVAVRAPARPAYRGGAVQVAQAAQAVAEAGHGAAGRILRISGAVTRSPIPRPRPVAVVPEPPAELLAAIEEDVAASVAALAEAEAQAEAARAAEAQAQAAEADTGPPPPRPEDLTVAALVGDAEPVADAPPQPAVMGIARAAAAAPPRPDALVARIAAMTAPAETDVAVAGMPAAEAASEATTPESSAQIVLAGALPAPLADDPAAPDMDGSLTALADPLAAEDAGAAVAMAPGPDLPTVMAGAMGGADSSMAVLPDAVPGTAVPDTGAIFLPEAPATVAALVEDPTLRPEPETPQIVSRLSTSGGRHWGVALPRMGSRYEAERVLITMSLSELDSLGQSLRKVVARGGGFEPSFLGMSQDEADRACARLAARGTECRTVGP